MNIISRETYQLLTLDYTLLKDLAWIMYNKDLGSITKYMMEVEKLMNYPKNNY